MEAETGVWGRRECGITWIQDAAISKPRSQQASMGGLGRKAFMGLSALLSVSRRSNLLGKKKKKAKWKHLATPHDNHMKAQFLCGGLCQGPATVSQNVVCCRGAVQGQPSPPSRLPGKKAGYLSGCLCTQVFLHAWELRLEPQHQR